mgnify:CR=1 FL=1
MKISKIWFIDEDSSTSCFFVNITGGGSPPASDGSKVQSEMAHLPDCGQRSLDLLWGQIDATGLAILSEEDDFVFGVRSEIQF